MNWQELKDASILLPDGPGVYRFYDRGGELIYVGKAKSLKKRVRSYFGKKQTGKTKVMLGKITEMQHTVVDTESEALLLENNLIKKHQPKYNVLLKDDKTFPWICLKKEAFPRLFITRNIKRDGSKYYGPYTSVVMLRTLIDLIKQLYPLRTCAYNLAKEKIEKNNYKVCLEYHIGNCKAPCIGEQDEEEYMRGITQIEEILKGNIYSVTQYLKNLMAKCASETKFEEAQIIKEKLNILNKYHSRSIIVNSRIKDVDVFGFEEDKQRIFVNYLKIIRGALVQTYTIELRKKIEESNKELIALAITEIRTRSSSSSPEIILPFNTGIKIDSVKYTVPQKGDKKKLLELAEKNARVYRLYIQNKETKNTIADRSARNLELMKKDLHLPTLPVHIECFDNSNIQGSNPVAACVVFRNGKPSKKEYRHFHIKTVKGADDFASMEEIVFRRYKRMLNEKQSLPDLVIIDGGKGQLNAAVKSLEKLGIRGRLTILGIAKRLEEIYFPGDSVPVYIDKNSYSLKIIQNLRNEAHRFGITFHRVQRSKSMLESSLDNIPGIGSKTKELLLKKFGTIEKIGNAGASELENIIGKSKAAKISRFLK